MRKLGLLLTAAWLIAGCSGGSKAPEPVYYLLRADVSLPAGAMTPLPEVGIGRISIADYLGQPGIVVAVNGDQLRPARQHLWAEPLDSSIRIFLRDAISAQAGQTVSGDFARRQNWRYRLDIRIDQWHGSLAGDAQLIASWVLIDVAEDREISRHRFDQSGALGVDGYDALVAAQTKLLMTLAGAIAGSLDALMDQASAERG